MRYSRSSHKELQEQFTDAPYKASTCVMVVHHTKNYQNSLLRLYADWAGNDMTFIAQDLKDTSTSLTSCLCQVLLKGTS